MKNAETNDFARKIRADYLVGRSETDADAEALGKLIKKITRPAKIFGYVFGIAGLLLFGAGMCGTLTAAADFFAAGVIVSLTGASMMVLDRPLYDTALTVRRNKYSGKVLALSGRLLENRA